MSENNTNTIKTLNIVGEITGTSNKTNDKFKQEKPSKTLYLKADEENSKKLINFGMTQYTSKEDGEDFFIIKASSNGIKVFCKGEKIDTIKTTLDTPNFHSVEHMPIQIAIMQGENVGNEFFRVYAVGVSDRNDIQENQDTNPFADM